MDMKIECFYDCKVDYRLGLGLLLGLGFPGKLKFLLNVFYHQNVTGNVLDEGCN